MADCTTEYVDHPVDKLAIFIICFRGNKIKESIKPFPRLYIVLNSRGRQTSLIQPSTAEEEALALLYNDSVANLDTFSDVGGL